MNHDLWYPKYPVSAQDLAEDLWRQKATREQAGLFTEKLIAEGLVQTGAEQDPED